MKKTIISNLSIPALFISLMMAVSITATAAEPIGAILTNEKQDTQVYAVCADVTSNESCEQKNIVIRTTNPKKLSQLVTQSAEQTQSIITSNIANHTSNAIDIIGAVGAAPAIVIVAPFILIDRYVFGVTQGTGTLTDIASVPAILVSAIPQFVTTVAVGLPVGLMIGKVEIAQTMKLRSKMLNPSLQGQVVTTRLVDNFIR